VAEGTNNLIKTGKAKMVTCAEDVLKEMGLSNGQMALDLSSQLSLPEADQPVAEDVRNIKEPVLEVLENESRSVDELARILRQPVNDILIKLSTLSLRGLIEERGGKYWKI
jgi:predicted Rossmann fold nucleotide-binding protein DprA/Smf involved in DNA uptake